MQESSAAQGVLDKCAVQESRQSSKTIETPDSCLKSASAAHSHAAETADLFGTKIDFDLPFRGYESRTT